MPSSSVVGFSGNITRPSKTRAFVDGIATEAAQRYGLESRIFDIEDLGPSFAAARWGKQLDAQGKAIVEAVTGAGLLVVGSPTYKGSYTGLFKHFFDLLDPASLRGKPVILTATGGSERHALLVEHQLRPLFGFFDAHALPTAIYATDADFAEGLLVSEPIRLRIQQAVADAGQVLAPAAPPGQARG